jgi:hypothetical protein
VKRVLDKLKTFHGRYAPWVSLALGVLARSLSHAGVDFAPKAVAILALAWLLPLAASRWLHAPAESVQESKFHWLLRTTSPTVTVLLYKNVLFFLVPVWFGSANFGSVNVLVPLLLAGMAFFTCFARSYRDLVLDEPRVRVLWTAIVLFAALVPATAVLAFTSPRTSIMISALAASAVAWIALAPRENLFSRMGLRSLAQISLPAAALLGLLAPLFPPVPMVCHDHGVGTAVVKRQLEGRAKHFSPGVSKVYAWFEVTLPKRSRQQVAFQWYHEGVPVGGPLRATVEGGRKEGYRTFSVHPSPAYGSWRVELLTDRSSQLIGRSSFEVDP